jgi:hypothetical protein
MDRLLDIGHQPTMKQLLIGRCLVAQSKGGGHLVGRTPPTVYIKASDNHAISDNEIFLAVECYTAHYSQRIVVTEGKRSIEANIRGTFCSNALA